MTADASPPAATVPIRVRYPECDPMGFAHHAVYPVWLEIARTDLLRQTGGSYADLERAGTFIVVVKLTVNYKRPARYDQLLHVTARLTRANGARIEHEYEIHHESDLLCTASTTLACLDKSGRIQPVPPSLQYP